MLWYPVAIYTTTSTVPALHSMTQDDWNQRRPDRVAGYRLGEVIVAYPEGAIFRAEAEDAGAPAGQVWLLETFDEEADTARVNRFLEATFFKHPNLLKIYGAGRQGAFLYVVSEAFETTLATMEPPRPLNPDTVGPILLPIAAGLEWLHSQDFVYCGLRPASVARVGQEWKLADFSELRVAGKSAPEETRRLLIRQDLYAPPEAYEGVVSPKWDAWSLGQTIHHLFAEEARALGKNPRVLEGGAGEMIQELLDTDPALRVSVGEFARRLREGRATAARAPKVAATAVSDSAITRRTNPAMPRAEAAPTRRIAALPGPQALAAPPARRIEELREPVGTGYEAIDDEESIAPWWKRRNRFATGVAVALIAGALVILGSIYRNPAVEAPRGERTAAASAGAAAPKPTPRMNARAAQTAKAPAAATVIDTARDKRQISQLLDRWVDATRQRDAYGLSTFYAPRVEEYFGRRNMTAADVRRVREKIFADSDEAREFSIEDVRVERLTGDRALVSFVKIWNFPGRPFMASAREEMTMRRVDGAWKIAGEREVGQGAGRETEEAEQKTRFAGNQ